VAIIETRCWQTVGIVCDGQPLRIGLQHWGAVVRTCGLLPRRQPRSVHGGLSAFAGVWRLERNLGLDVRNQIAWVRERSRPFADEPWSSCDNVETAR
jgi:hypothetical protein